MISVLFLLLPCFQVLLFGTVPLADRTVEFPRLISPQNGLGLCDLAKVCFVLF